MRTFLLATLAIVCNVVVVPAFADATDLKTIMTPVLVMAGDHDFTPIEETIELFHNLPRGQLFILPATGHGTMQDRPELVNPAMREFLERVDEVSTSP